jgi:hypothetical protein
MRGFSGFTDVMTGGPRGTDAMASIPLNGFRRRNATTRGSRGLYAMTRGSRRTDAMESLIPTCTLAAMVPVIKILVITLTSLVSAPIGMLLLKTLPVMRLSLIPLMPPRFIPGNRSDNIGRRISVIRGPSILRPEKIIQHPF